MQIKMYLYWQVSILVMSGNKSEFPRIAITSTSEQKNWLKDKEKEYKTMNDHIAKGGLISEFFSFWLKSPKKGANYPEHCPSDREDVQGGDLAPFLGRFEPK